MRVRLLRSALAESAPEQQYLTTFLVNDTVAIDAGSLGISATLEEQRRITDVFISHSHMDHLASLPTFLENVYTQGDDCPSLHVSDAVRAALQEHIFNDRIWPDFIGLSEKIPPFLKLKTLRERQAVEIGKLSITPVSVNHSVPTFGFILEEAGKSVVIISDSGPTEEIWKQGKARLQAVFLEASFPESLAELAHCARHLTPKLLAAELKKIGRGVRILAIHLKSAFHSRLVRELDALGIPGLEVALPGKEYEF